MSRLCSCVKGIMRPCGLIGAVDGLHERLEIAPFIRGVQRNAVIGLVRAIDFCPAMCGDQRSKSRIDDGCVVPEAQAAGGSQGCLVDRSTDSDSTHATSVAYICHSGQRAPMTRWRSVLLAMQSVPAASKAWFSLLRAVRNDVFQSLSN